MIGEGLELRDIWVARRRIAPYIRHTPLVRSPHLSDAIGTDAYLKLENLQDIGAFKIRGAANKILSLDSAERARGVTTFSTGNHALAVSSVARSLGVRAVICVSNRVPSVKIDAIRRYGAEIRVHGASQDDAEALCRRLAYEEGMTIVSPFDDPEVIAGQGTIALELFEDLPDLDMVVVPTSGGGLISGIAIGVKATHRYAIVCGVSMEQGAAMRASIDAGRPVVLEEVDTLADSLLGGIGSNNKYTFSLVRDLVNDIVLIPEIAIANGMDFLFRYHRIAVEGAAATGVGALLCGAIRVTSGHRVAVIITGCNVDHDAFLKAIRQS